MLDLTADFGSRDPTEALARAGNGCPYQWEPERHALYAFRAPDVGKVLTDEDFWSERAPDRRTVSMTEKDRERRAELRDFLTRWPVFSDGDYHGRLRRVAIRLLRGVVTPELLRSCERLVTRRLAGAGDGGFDWMDRVARPLATEVVGHLIGADAAHVIELGSIVMDELATPRIDIARVHAALTAIDELRDWLRGSLAEPTSALVGGLAELWQDRKFGPEPATALLTQIVTGAYEPIATCLGLAGERVTGEVLAALPMRTVRNEVFRLATPFRFASRYARHPTTVGPHRLAEGDRITVCLAAANLDAGYYPEPVRFQQRKTCPVSHSFGAGQHYCPGAPLAHAVLSVLLDSLVRLGVQFVPERVEREPELPMLRYRQVYGRLTRMPLE